MNEKLYVVGLGPGDAAYMAPAAKNAIEASQVIVGYKTYLDLIDPLLEGKEVVSSGMMKEIDRCRQAIEIAASGRSVALVSSGDSGIYGMAGLVIELLEDEAVEVEIIPGISAVQAAAARLGAPLMHDFAVISLSDLMTPWRAIRRRLEAAGGADFVIALYNPRSKGRSGQIVEAREILLRHRSPETPVGIVRNACRQGEEVIVTDLASMLDHPIDMLTVVLIGNSATRLKGHRILTPRGYAEKYLEGRNEALGSRHEENLEPGTCNLEPVPERARALFVGGTGSDVGKSVLAAGLCRILKNRGHSVAPFKAQNMALNSAVTPEGGEIGRAQALQAAACRIEPHTDMNPVLLKPNSDTGSQVIVDGRPVGNMTVGQYHAYKAEVFEKVTASFARLAEKHGAVVMEGAGSIAEINLMEHDITNLRAAAMAEAPVLLVADIDRGGVFASIVGTLELLSRKERARIAGVIINKFRGEPALLKPGIEAIEERCGVRVLGVVPWFDLNLPEEDSVALSRRRAGEKGGGVRIGVVRLPRISNYTDFDVFDQDEGVELLYIDSPEAVEGLDLLILPGTKSTIADLDFLRKKGLDSAILDYHAAGGTVAGICGGFQMLGRTVADPHGVESDVAEAEGLGLLDAETVLCEAKQTHRATGALLEGSSAAGFEADMEVSGYEIHMGETSRGTLARPLLRLTSRSGAGVDMEEGAVSPDGRVWGTYLHGVFDSAPLRRALLGRLCSARGTVFVEGSVRDLDSELDRLADHLSAHLDLERIFEAAGLGDRGCSWNG